MGKTFHQLCLISGSFLGGLTLQGAATYTVEIITPEEQLLSGGVQDFPVYIREYVTFGGEFFGFFGERPVQNFTVAMQSSNSILMSFDPITGFEMEVLFYDPPDADGLYFELTADPPIDVLASNSPVSGIKEWFIGTLRINLGPPVLIDDGGPVPDILLLELDIDFGGGNYQVELDDPTSGSGFQLTPTGIEIYTDVENLEPDESEVQEVDGEALVIDAPATNTGILTAKNTATLVVNSSFVNMGVIGVQDSTAQFNGLFTNAGTLTASDGAEVILSMDTVNFGTFEALSDASIAAQDVEIRQIDAGDADATWDDALRGGTFRTVNGALNVAPDGFILAEIEGGTLEISGTRAETNFFDEDGGSPGQFTTGGRSLTISEEAMLRLDDGAKLDIFGITLFGGRLEVVGGAEVSLFTFVSGSSGSFVGDGTINGDLDVGSVEIGDNRSTPGTLTVDGNLSFQVQSRLLVDILSDTELDTVSVSGRLFIQNGSIDGAGLVIHLPDGYVPDIGKQFQVATASTIDGNFDIICDNSPHVDFRPVLSANTLVLEVVPDPLGAFRLEHDMATDGSEDNVDRSGNGLADILYYFYGLGNPDQHEVNPEHLPSFRMDPENNRVSFTFVRPAYSPCHRFLAYTSDDLESWVFPNSLGLDFLSMEDFIEELDDTYIRVTRSFNLREDETARFYMLVIEHSLQ